MSYSWGSDSGGSWGGGYTYSSARAANSRRTYSAKTMVGNPSKVASYPLEGISTDSKSPLVVAVDVTGSMSDWRDIIFEKLPLLYGEAKRYLPDTEISFAAIGDVFVDTYPIQVADFYKGKSLDDKIRSFVHCDGGGNGGESYDLMASFYLSKCDIPNAKKPIFVFTGDDDIFANTSDDRMRKYLGGNSEGINGVDAVRQLTKKFDTYLLTKNGYTTDNWESALGKEKILSLDDPGRVVDTLIGIVAGATGNFDDFTKRLGTRQTKAQAQTVMKTLHSIAIGNGTQALQIRGSRGGTKKSKALI